MLAVRFKRPLPIVAGIAVATLFNHALAALVGEWLRAVLGPEATRWVIGLAFLAMGLWALKPDTLEEGEAKITARGVFLATAFAFFLVEMGDKTQIATVMLAAKFRELVPVVAGTTIGMLLANVPVVLAGNLAARRIPFKAIRIGAALLFGAMGLWVLVFGIE
jgi:Ca2+/H+ antiporter, TMEM165/GDT1 family